MNIPIVKFTRTQGPCALRCQSQDVAGNTLKKNMETETHNLKRMWIYDDMFKTG
jgi:hypothetical protein